MFTIDLGEIFYSFSKSLDLSLDGVTYHHQSVALITAAIAENLDLSDFDRQTIFYSALVHDAGMNPRDELKYLLPYEDTHGSVHCKKGYEIFRHSKLTEDVARIILHHHDRWQDTIAWQNVASIVPLGSNIVYLADRVAVLCEAESTCLLHRSQAIIQAIVANSGTKFNPVIVAAFLKAAAKEAFWLDLRSDFISEIVQARKPKQTMQVSPKILTNIAKCFSQVIDNKSPYTRDHSTKVALGAEYLGRKLGFIGYDLTFLRLAGYLHDLGKLAIPNEILDKPGQLSEAEFAIIKNHTYHSYYLLRNIPGFESVSIWGSQHHEKLDGSGYPHNLTGEHLSLGSRIMAVSDIFAALTEDRPYRDGLNKAQCLAILLDLSANNKIDSTVVALVEENYEEMIKLTQKKEPHSAQVAL
ncbi:MAG: HD domain-containing protein [Peptococcaceae bacterium]|nr:HD domain-containing protein [Peptococcaceae bacterium]